MARNLGILTIFSVIIFSGCGPHYNQNPYSQVKAFLESPHNLRKMTESKDSRAYISGEFFLFVGGMSGKADVIHSVKFAWNMGDNVYPIVSVPLEKVRIRTVEKKETPSVAFFLDDREINQRFDYLTSWDSFNNYEDGRWRVENSELGLLGNRDDIPRFLNEYQDYLKYVVITCNEFDWPQNVSLPFNDSAK